MTELIGQMLGPYRIIEQIGMGGMATVYRAYQLSMDRYVAVKVLPRHLAQSSSFMGRFEQEAHTIAKLEHPHTVHSNGHANANFHLDSDANADGHIYRYANIYSHQHRNRDTD